MHGEGPAEREAAHRDALTLLARRPLSEAELQRRLAARAHGEAAVEWALRRLRESGYLDDLRLAQHFIATRAARLGHGPRRLIGQLVARGIDPDCAARALRRAVEEGEIDPDELLRREIRRRLGARARPENRRDHARVYNALLRAGYESDRIEAQLGAAPCADEASEVTE